MKEVEILCKLNTVVQEAGETILNITDKNMSKVWQYEGSKKIVDTYYSHSAAIGTVPDKDGRITQSLRLRDKDGKCSITFKDDRFGENGIWKYSDELETTYDDQGVLRKILEKLACIPLVVVSVVKHVYRSGDVEIVIEEVEDLGNFIEIEMLTDENGDDIDAKSKIRALLQELSISVGEELNMGKPEMLIRKKMQRLHDLDLQLSNALQSIQDGNYWQVCGPITSNGHASISENIGRIQQAITEMTRVGRKIFNQTTYEPALQKLIDAHIHTYDEILNKFYGELFASGKISGICLLPGWENSYGCRYEERKARELGIEIVKL